MTLDFGALRRAHLRLLRDAHRLGGRAARRVRPGAGGARRDASTTRTLLERYADHEARLEAGPYLRYRDVLAEGPARRRARSSGSSPTERRGRATFGGSVVDWPAFPDSAAALARLAIAIPAGRPDQLRRRPVRGLRTLAWASPSTGSSPPSRSARTSRPRRNFERLLRDGSTCRATGSCTSPRACTTTTSRRSGSGCRPSGSTAATTARAPARPRPADATPDATFPDMASFAAAAVAD